MYPICLSTLRRETCAALNGAAESTVPDTRAMLDAVPALPPVWGAAAFPVTLKTTYPTARLAVTIVSGTSRPRATDDRRPAPTTFQVPISFSFA